MVAASNRNLKEEVAHGASAPTYSIASMWFMFTFPR